MLKSIILYKKKMQWYFRKISFENMYVESVKNEEIISLKFEWFMFYL